MLDLSRQASSSAKFETLLAAIGCFAYFGLPEPPLLPPPWCCCCRLFVLRNEKGLFLLPAGVVAHLSVSAGGPEQLHFCSFLCLLRPSTRHSALNHSGDLPLLQYPGRRLHSASLFFFVKALSRRLGRHHSLGFRHDTDLKFGSYSMQIKTLGSHFVQSRGQFEHLGSYFGSTGEASAEVTARSVGSSSCKLM